MADVVVSAWVQYEDLVKWTVWKIVRKYGGDFEELYSEALVHFTEAVQCYEPYCGKLSNWISFRVYKGLQEIKRTQARRLRITGAVGRAEDNLVNAKRDFWSEINRAISVEAQQVLEVLLHVESRGKYNGKNWSILKAATRSVLKKEHGYTNDLVNLCYSEIAQVLT